MLFGMDSSAKEARQANFGSPDFEPSDEQLHELVKEAFADVGARNKAAMTELKQAVDRLRHEVLGQPGPSPAVSGSSPT